MSNIFPSAFLRALKEDFNIEGESLLSNAGGPVTSIRLNPFKATSEFADEEQVPWSTDGKYLKERPSFIADPLFHAGCYYVQEASSMFLEQALRQTADLTSPLRVLDLCASPGGKSTLINSLISEESLLVSNEIIKARANVLADNLTKWGTINSVVTNNDPKDFKRLEGYFDVMVIDAPCSGSGMFRKDPDTIQHWSEGAVQLCSERQQRILADVYPALKEDGILIYSTCSYSKEENEVIADWLSDEFGMESIRLEIEETWGIVETQSDKNHCYGYRFYPDKVKGEGFFIACFRKTETTPDIRLYKEKVPSIGKKELEILKGWTNPENDLYIIPVGDEYAAIDSRHATDLAILQAKLYLKKSGIRLGKIAGKDLIPDHELALSLIVNSQIPRIEVSAPEALKYLRKDEVKFEEQHETGWALITFGDYPLGWVKVLPNRINNYFPKELRILKEF
jgi:16S rRNA C967 or C1407 C5-methylase (RsmB/RsmF family)/NOL1/NOP2/fmu family ribosome biogenesis protein